jgi:hypothetical protein
MRMLQCDERNRLFAGAEAVAVFFFGDEFVQTTLAVLKLAIVARLPRVGLSNGSQHCSNHFFAAPL